MVKDKLPQKKPAKTKEIAKKPPLPDIYLDDLPHDPGRATFKVEWEGGKGSAHASAPATHLNNLAGLTIGTVAAGAPVATIAIACTTHLSAATIIALTAMVSTVSLVALVLIYLFRRGDPPA